MLLFWGVVTKTIESVTETTLDETGGEAGEAKKITKSKSKHETCEIVYGPILVPAKNAESAKHIVMLRVEKDPTKSLDFETDGGLEVHISPF